MVFPFHWETRHFPKAIVIIRNVPTTITKGKNGIKSNGLTRREKACKEIKDEKLV